MQTPNHSLDRDLMYALSFDAHDLRANRSGRLTERQCKVRRVRENNATRYFGWSVFIFAFAVLYLLVGGDGLVFYLGIGYVYLLVLAAWWWSRIRVDLKERRVLSISGHVSLDIRPHRFWASYYVTVKHIRLEIDQETMLAFRNGEPYTIYFTPRAEMVVAAEPL